MLDNFNRPNNLSVGVPSSVGGSTWLETETSGSNNYRIRIENNMLVLGSFNSASSGVGSSGLEQASNEVSNQYATTFSQAAAPLNWAFNFRQNRSGTSGFGATTYGVAYILGCNKPVFTDPNAVGYAVVLGNSGSPDYVRLVSFKNGFTVNSNLTTLVSSPEFTETAYYSVKVTYDPCSKSWGLQVRNDGASFADPLTVQEPVLTFSDQTHTNTNLNFTGAAYNHGTANVTAYFDNISVPNSPYFTAQTYTWTGSLSSDFTEPGNWNPTRNCHRNSDILTFNAGGTINLSNVSSQEFGKLLVQNNTALSLKAKAGSTQTLQIAGGNQEDLVVGAGSSLIIDSNDALEISLKTGTTGIIAGNFTFQNTAMNLGRAHRLLVADANALTVTSGAQVNARNLNGEPFGITGTANAVIFKAGSVYISKDGASPFGLATPNSKVVFETGSLYRHEQVGTAPKFDGRVYADFELNVTNALAIIFGTSAPVPTRIDNFTISSGTMNVTLASGSTPLPLQIKGNLTIAPGATFNFNPANAVNTSPISLNGTKKQQISGTLNLGQYANLELNNQAGAELLTPLTIKGNLQFSQGILTLGPVATLTFEDNAATTGAWSGSYVNGRIIKTGDDAFSFPTGKGGYFAPIGISAPQNVTDKFSAEYFPENPVTLFGSLKHDSLGQISSTEYWDLERLAGASEVKVTLSYDPGRSISIADPNELRVAHYKGGDAGWANEGKPEMTTSESSMMLLSTRKMQSSFSPFTFASVASNNPLPVELVNFTAKAGIEIVVLNWTTATEQNAGWFEVERSSNSRDFEKVGEVRAAGNSTQLKQYGFEDKKPGSGVIYYRLKQVDLDGTFTYSKTVALTVKENEFLYLYPNPASEQLTIRLSSSASATIQILNILGQAVWLRNNISGSEVKLDIAQLPAGTYQLIVETENGRATRKFVKVGN
ncbi:T9SS type A sorting domain-containing protein [Adhaeribacter soli]|uniref:T9SS type A sorting domain-containing protein n=1 Tax=Adhaeribacter soli TaxID=2607655 RepID=UPI0017871FB5|nr:T9SS type A sorting domain-containing protein [Adhaeribacter soli]